MYSNYIWGMVFLSIFIIYNGWILKYYFSPFAFNSPILVGITFNKSYNYSLLKVDFF